MMTKVLKENSVSEMTLFKVYPGIELIYYKFDVPNFNLDTLTTEDIMEISHCRKGRVECELQDGTYLYLGEGDLGINMMNNHALAMDFPVQYYEGISVNLNMSVLKYNLPEILDSESFDIKKIKEKFCKNNGCFVMRTTEKIEHIFSELYSIPDEIKGPYLKIKVIELLLFMSVIDKTVSEKKGSYYKIHVDTVKRIKNEITENYSKRYTIDELSKEHCVSPTTLKMYFKEVYGTTINAFMKNYRMKKASQFLRETSDSIGDIAYKVSYESQSKFAKAFRDVYEMSPIEYRKKCLVGNNTMLEEGKNE